MSSSHDRILGVLGGMGPLASAQFMLRLTELTEASCDQEHVPAVLWSDPRIPPRRRADVPGPLPALLRGVRGLVQAGCGAIAIPCNTAHGWYDEMAAEGTPILHIVDAAAAQLAPVAPPGSVVGIMGTEQTLAMRLYEGRLEARGWTCLVPSPAEMRGLVVPAIAAVKANRVGAAQAPLMAAVQSLAARGARAVVLGCTEIPIGLKGAPSAGVALVDTIDALALAAIAWAGKRHMPQPADGAAADRVQVCV